MSEQLGNAQSTLAILDIIAQRRDDLANDGTELDNSKKNTLDDAERDAVKKQQQEAKALLENYADVLDKKIALEQKYYNDRELLKRQKEQAASEEERQQIERSITVREKEYEKDLHNLLRVRTEANIKMIELTRDNQLWEILRNKYKWESDRRKDMLVAQKQAAEEILKQFQELYKEAPTDELANEIERITREIEDMNAELEKIPIQKLHEMLSGLQQITSALSGLDGELGEVFASVGKAVEGIKLAFDETATTTDKVSSGISAIVDIINMVSSASKERQRVEKEFYRNQIALAHEYALALNEQLRIQSEISGSGFITDYSGKIKDGFDALTEATEGYQEALGKLSEGKAKIDLRDAIDWGKVGKGAASGATAGAAIGSIVPVIGTAIGAVAGAIIGGIAGLFGGKKKKEEYGGLLDVFPELVDGAGKLNKELAQTLINTQQVDENTRQLIQNALDWADAMDKAHEQIKGVVVELAGDLGGSLKNSIVDAWKAGEDASKRMFDAASKSLEGFVEDLLYSTIFSDVFDEFADRLAESLTGGDGDIVDDFDWLMDEMDARDDYFIGLLEAVKNRAENRGYNLWKKDVADEKADGSLTGVAKGVTEETASMLGGQVNAMRMNQLKASEILRQQLMQLSVIAQNTSYNFHLAKLERIVTLLEKGQTGDPLRAQGLGNYK